MGLPKRSYSHLRQKWRHRAVSNRPMERPPYRLFSFPCWGPFSEILDLLQSTISCWKTFFLHLHLEISTGLSGSQCISQPLAHHGSSSPMVGPRTWWFLWSEPLRCWSLPCSVHFGFIQDPIYIIYICDIYIYNYIHIYIYIYRWYRYIVYSIYIYV